MVSLYMIATAVRQIDVEDLDINLRVKGGTLLVSFLRRKI